jgi:hypothetical protein
MKEGTEPLIPPKMQSIEVKLGKKKNECTNPWILNKNSENKGEIC